jgi:hypothetical protein
MSMPSSPKPGRLASTWSIPMIWPPVTATTDPPALFVPKPGSCDPQTLLAEVVVRCVAPGSGEFNDSSKSCSAHVDVAGVGGKQAVATVGTPLAIGLPGALERPRTRGRLPLASSDRTSRR